MLDQPNSGPSFSLRQLLTAAEAHVRAYITREVEAEYVYHDLGHTLGVVEAVRQLGPLENVEQEAQQLLELAAWFHDTGYARGPEGHELRGCINAKAFLRPRGLTDEQLNRVCSAIEATKLPQQPRDLLGQLLCDADMSHLGTKDYWSQCNRLRQEFLLTRGIVMKEAQWIDFEIEFLTKHRYFTEAAMDLFGKKKRKHLKQLRKQKLALSPSRVEGVDQLAKQDKKQKKRRKQVDAAMRSEPTPPEAQPTTTDLAVPRDRVSATAPELLRAALHRTERQANGLVIGGALAIVLVVIGLVPQLSEQRALLVPGFLLLLTCLATVTLATLAVRSPSADPATGLRRKQTYLSRSYSVLLVGLVLSVLVFVWVLW